jgi:beta-xylosidase
MQTSDDFSASTVAPQWEWNHQPREGRWSLAERPGFLRLHAFGQLHEGDFFTTRNILSQRYIRWGRGEAATRIDLSGMADGQRAGMAHFNGGKDYACIEVRRDSGKLSLWFIRRYRGEDLYEKYLGDLPGRTRRLVLRTTMDFDGTAGFAWSLDGRHFRTCDETYRLTWGNYRGDRIGLYTFNNVQEAGVADFDSFVYSPV